VRCSGVLTIAAAATLLAAACGASSERDLLSPDLDIAQEERDRVVAIFETQLGAPGLPADTWLAVTAEACLPGGCGARRRSPSCRSMGLAGDELAPTRSGAIGRESSTPLSYGCKLFVWLLA